MKKPKTVPLGPKPVRSDETRAALATVTPAREVRAVEFWVANAPKGSEGLIEAKGEEPKA